MNENVIKALEVAPGQIGEPTYLQFCQTLWDGGYTGLTIVHWLHGRPQMIELPHESVQVVISQPSTRPRPPLTAAQELPHS